MQYLLLCSTSEGKKDIQNMINNNISSFPLLQVLKTFKFEGMLKILIKIQIQIKEAQINPNYKDWYYDNCE